MDELSLEGWLTLFRFLEAPGELVDDLRRLLHLLDVREAKLLIGLSGGPDSTALTHLLWSLKDEFQLKLEAFHLNHRIRSTAWRDAEIARELCANLGIPFHYREVDVLAVKELRGGSLEAVARDERYRVALELAVSINADALVLAHTLDDLAVTLLINLLRGASLKGLTSLQMLSEKEGITVFRPLLFRRKEELLEYLKLHGLTYAVDETNYDLRYTRNRIYLKLLDVLRELNPKVETALAKTSLSLLLIRAYFSSEVELLRKRVIDMPHGWLIPDEILSAHPSLITQLFRELLGQLPRRQRFESSDLLNLERALRGDRVSVAKGWLAERLQYHLVIYSQKPEIPEVLLDELPKEREVFLEPWMLEVKLRGEVKGLRLRTRKPGDRVRVGRYKRKLKKVLSELGLPIPFRDVFPLIVDEEDVVVGIPGVLEGLPLSISGKWLEVALSYIVRRRM